MAWLGRNVRRQPRNPAVLDRDIQAIDGRLVGPHHPGILDDKIEGFFHDFPGVSSRTTLIENFAGLLDDRRPALDVVAHEGGELGRGVADHRSALVAQLLAKLRIAQRRGDRGV